MALRPIYPRSEDLSLEDYAEGVPVSAASKLKMATSVDAKLLKQTKFPAEFSQKVDMKKVNVEVMKK